MVKSSWIFTSISNISLIIDWHRNENNGNSWRQKSVEVDKILKIAGLNIGIAVADTILFSPGLIGLQMGGTSALATAFGATAIFISVAVFGYGNYTLLVKQEKIMQTHDLKTAEDCVAALKQNHDKKTFQQEISTILEQLERFQNKLGKIKNMLLQKFNSTEMSYQKFERALLDVENVFYINIKSIINKLSAFDEQEYKRIQKDEQRGKFSADVIRTKLSIYNEYISFVKNASEDNEEIILKLDQLLLEISKFNSLEDGEIENMSEMKELDELISKTKLYK